MPVTSSYTQESDFLLAIDQGTSGTKSLLVDSLGKVVAKATQPLKTQYLDKGWVEQDPQGILENVRISVKKCLQTFEESQGFFPKVIAAGISNQRETFVLWDENGNALAPAVVWQCKRSIAVCEDLKDRGLDKKIREKTGLIIDPYFSGSKLIWLHQESPSIREKISSGEAFFGTVDTWLLYSLTGGKSYATDYTNASRTLFFNIQSLTWDKELLRGFGLEGINLPACHPSSFAFGTSDFWGLFPSPVPITGMIGDSHAAAFGEGCFLPGTAKATLGTGSSILMNIGDQLKYSEHGMVTTICWSTEKQVQYALEGVIVTCGATIEWLKNQLGILADSKDSEKMAKEVENNGGVYLIPAFSGLGAPHWDMNRKASIVGLTFSSTKNHLIRAALESIPYQISDVLEVMEQDAGMDLQQLMVDGGISSSEFIVQFLSDLLQKEVVNIGIPDVSALGAAYMAGLKAGVFRDLEHLKSLSVSQKTYTPKDPTQIHSWHQEWKKYLSQG